MAGPGRSGAKPLLTPMKPARSQESAQPCALKSSHGSTAAAPSGRAPSDSRRPSQARHVLEVHAVDGTDQCRRQRTTASAEKILMVVFCSLLIMSSVASSRNVIFIGKIADDDGERFTSRLATYTALSALVVAALGHNVAEVDVSSRPSVSSDSRSADVQLPLAPMARMPTSKRRTTCAHHPSPRRSSATIVDLALDRSTRFPPSR